jgi:hypothetical protein
LLLDIGSVFQELENGELRLNLRTRACIQDMQRVAQKRGLGLLDCQSFVEGWRQGSEWGLQDNGTEDSAASK